MVAFCGILFSVEQFLNFLAARKTEGNLEKLLEAHYASQGISYSGSIGQICFQYNPTVTLQNAILKPISRIPRGAMLEENCPLRIYYVENSDVVLFGQCFPNKCLIPNYIQEIIQTRIVRFDLKKELIVKEI